METINSTHVIMDILQSQTAHIDVLPGHLLKKVQAVTSCREIRLDSVV